MAKVWISADTQVEMADYPGMRSLHLNVDGYDVRAQPGQTILELVEGLPGIGNIPTLCHHHLVPPYGACRVCTVEVEDGGRTRFVTACLFPVKEGLVVKTDSERVRKIRKGVLGLLLARCPNTPRVQQLAKEYGVDKPRYILNDTDCTLCGLCVRACRQNGRAAISLVNRGIYKEVAAPFYEYELGDQCVKCGDCVNICPTGAIKFGPDGKPVLPKVRIPHAEAEAIMREAEEEDKAKTKPKAKAKSKSKGASKSSKKRS